MTDSKSQLLIAAGATVATVAVTSAVLSSQKRSSTSTSTEPTMTERAAEMLAGPPPSPADFGLPEGTEFGTFTNQKGTTIHTMKLKAALSPKLKKPKAVVVCLHGICDHSSRHCYSRVYSRLSEAGVDVYAMDHVGHGLSGGERGYVDDYFDWVDDATDFCNQSIEASGGGVGGEGGGDTTASTTTSEAPPPLFLIGQSLGANIASHVALRLAEEAKHPPAGLVLTSPAFGVDMDPILKIQNFFGALLNKAVPRAKLVDGVRPEDLTRNVEEVEDFKNDPLIFHGNLKVRAGIMIMEGFKSMEKKRGGINCPLLVLHGDADETTSMASSLDFFANVGTPKEQKRFIKLKGFYHEIYNEPEREKAMDMILKFVSSQGKDLPDMDGGNKARSEGGGSGEEEMESVIELDLVGAGK